MAMDGRKEWYVGTRNQRKKKQLMEGCTKDEALLSWLGA
jgi:hypothetical protein